MNSAVPQYLLESSFCLAVFYLFYWFALREQTCFRFNRLYLLGALCVALTLPLVSLPTLLPAATVELVQSGEALGAPTVPAPSMLVVGEAGPDLGDATADHRSLAADALCMLYGLGLLFFGIRFLWHLGTIFALAKRHSGHAFGYSTSTVILTGGEQPTFSFLHYIFFDNSQELTREEEDLILQHEQAHVEQRHTCDVLFVSLLQIFFWFNPLLGLYKKALGQTHEFLADAAVAESTGAREYTRLLVRQAFSGMGASIGSFFTLHASQTLKRIKMMDKRNSSPGVIRRLASLPVVACVILAISAARPSSPMEEPPAMGKLPVAQRQDGFQRAEWPGPRKGRHKFMMENVQVPEVAFQENAPGTMFEMSMLMVLNIDEQGNVTLDPSSYKRLEVSPYSQKVAEAVWEEYSAAVKKMPKWRPALRNGKPVSSVDSAATFITLPLPAYEEYISNREKRVSNSPYSMSGENLFTKDGSRVFTFVEQPPSFPGGSEALRVYLERNAKLPLEAKGGKGEKVVLRLVVNNAGSIEDIQVVKSGGDKLDAEAVRLVKDMPVWSPARQGGEAIAAMVPLTISFSHSSSK